MPESAVKRQRIASNIPTLTRQTAITMAYGLADVPCNMQWQSVAEGKAKDKWERKLWNYILNVGVTGHSGLLYALSGYS